MLAKPTAEGEGDSHSQQKTCPVQQSVGQGETVIGTEKRQQEDEYSCCRDARGNFGKQTDQECKQHEKTKIHKWREPHNLLGNVHHWAPAGPVDLLEKEEPGAFD